MSRNIVFSIEFNGLTYLDMSRKQFIFMRIFVMQLLMSP